MNQILIIRSVWLYKILVSVSYNPSYTVQNKIIRDLVFVTKNRIFTRYVTCHVKKLSTYCLAWV